MPQPPVKEYPKTHLRAILPDPTIDATNKKVLDTAPRMSYKRFYEKVNPVIEKHCKHLLTLDKWKQIKIVPIPIVKILFEKLL